MKNVLVDTSVWVDHFRRGKAQLSNLLTHDLVMMHPLISGEIACGTPPNRGQTLAYLDRLKPAHQASMRETMRFIEHESLFGNGCGLIDLLLLTSTLLTPNTEIWTLDKKLAELANRFGVMHSPLRH